MSNRKEGRAKFSLYLSIRNWVTVLGAQSSSALKDSAPLRLPVMDDEEILRSSLEALLIDLGRKPVMAANGEAAIEAYQKMKFDALILDLTVPGGMSGRQTLAYLAKLDPAVQTIASSGYAEDQIMANPQKYGFVGVLAKPYGVEQIQEILARLRVQKRNQS